MFLQHENRFVHVKRWLSIILAFHLRFWRMKNAEENALNKFQRSTYNVLKLRFENTFMDRNHQIFLFFLPKRFRWFDAFRSIMPLQIIWWVLTGNVIGKPDTLSLNMPLDLYLWNEPHMGDTVWLPISLLVSITLS